MSITEIHSADDLQRHIKQSEKTYLLLYKEKTGKEDCAYTNIKSAQAESETIKILAANVSLVKDIHPLYDISSVPSLLIFENEKLINLVKGCNSTEYYKSLFKETIFSEKSEKNKNRQPKVTVFGTPGCGYCTKLRKYLEENKISYKYTDVSNNQKAAEAMVKRSGQQGVPQTLIGSKIVVGFDKNKIDNMLGIN